MRRILAAITSDSIIALALFAFGCAAPAVKPPFSWDFEFASPGKALAILEASRLATPRGTQVLYRIQATGFTRADQPTLWWHRGADYEPIAIRLTDAGVVQVSPGVDDFAIVGFVSGQPIDMALVSAGSGDRAQAKVVPFPIEAQGTGGCSRPERPCMRRITSGRRYSLPITWLRRGERSNSRSFSGLPTGARRRSLPRRVAAL